MCHRGGTGIIKNNNDYYLLNIYYMRSVGDCFCFVPAYFSSLINSLKDNECRALF